MPTSFEQETARKQREYASRVAARSAQRGSAPPEVDQARVNRCKLLIAHILLSTAEAEARLEREINAAAADPAFAQLDRETQERRALYTLLRALDLDPDEC